MQRIPERRVVPLRGLEAGRPGRWRSTNCYGRRPVPNASLLRQVLFRVQSRDAPSDPEIGRRRRSFRRPLASAGL